MSAFSGLDELIADMQNLPDVLKGEAAKHIEGAANGAVAEIRQRYKRGKTGNLIKGVGKRVRGPLDQRVYSRAPHVHLYEFGSYKTGERYWKTGKGTGRLPAQGPIFVPVVVRHRRRLLLDFQEMLRRAKVRHMTGSAV